VAEAHLRHGRPAKEITEIAAGLVVLGDRGFSDLERLVLGSVSEAVARYASCSVLIVRQEEGYG
jgi:nucleotide-binding universal stress UspA family protein